MSFYFPKTVDNNDNTLNATSIRGINVSSTLPTDGQVLEFDSGSSSYVPTTLPDVKQTVIIIRNDADLLAHSPLQLAPDGVMRSKLFNGNNYYVDVLQWVTSIPLWFEGVSGSTYAQPVSMRSEKSFNVVYLGTDTYIYSERGSRVELILGGFIAINPGTKFGYFSATRNPGVVTAINFDLCAFVGFGQIDIVGYAFILMNQNALLTTKPIRVHNFDGVFVDKQSINRLIYGATGEPAFVFTGTNGNISFDKSPFDLNATDSGIAVDTGSTYQASANFLENAFPADAGTSFFQTDLTGNLTAMADLTTLITGSPASFTDSLDSTSKVLVTHVGHSTYLDLTITVIGTVNYNGTFKIIESLGLNRFVIDVAYVADEIVGSYTGVGTRITSVAHAIDPHRQTIIANTTNYNGTHITKGNTANTFDIDTVFVADDGVGDFLTQSFDKTSPVVVATSNGALPDSDTLGSFIWSGNLTQTIISDATFTKLAGTTIQAEAERCSMTANNQLTFTNLNITSEEAQFNLSIVRGSGSGSPEMEFTIFKNSSQIMIGASDVVARIQTNSTTPTLVSLIVPVTVIDGDVFEIFGRNITNTSDILVQDGQFIIH